MEPRCITEQDYLTVTVGNMPTASFIRATAGMSAIALKRAQNAHLAKLNVWVEKRDAARAEYAKLVEAGEIVVPTRIQRLIDKARQHPDRRDTQAARRVLAKRNISWEVVA